MYINFTYITGLNLLVGGGELHVNVVFFSCRYKGVIFFFKLEEPDKNGVGQLYFFFSKIGLARHINRAKYLLNDKKWNKKIYLYPSSIFKGICFVSVFLQCWKPEPNFVSITGYIKNKLTKILFDNYYEVLAIVWIQITAMYLCIFISDQRLRWICACARE